MVAIEIRIIQIRADLVEIMDIIKKLKNESIQKKYFWILPLDLTKQ